MNIRPLLLLATTLLAGLAFTGCETTDAPSGSVIGATALPLSTLDQLYAARTAMISLADGSAEDPAAASAVIAGSLPVFEYFAESLKSLERSFDSSDSSELWENLERMGSLYQFNIAVRGAGELRWLQSNLTGFRNDVADLRRVFGQYLESFQSLVAATGPDVPAAAVQAQIPLVNHLTELSVPLDHELSQFSDNLRSLAQVLQRGP